jgi:hypothetical protein
MLKAMRPTTPLRIGFVLLALGAALPALADTQFRIRKMTRDDVPLGKGQCDIRLQVDDQVEVTVRRDNVFIRTISGRDAYDDGSECNAPLPDRDPVGFTFEVKDSRNEIRLIGEPMRRNDFAAVVLIRDTASGFGRYHFRLSWQMSAADYRHDDGPRRDNDRPDEGFRRDNDRPGPPGFAWNNTINYRGNGRGTAAMNDFGPTQLSDVTVDIDRGGRINVWFRGERGRDLVFSGIVVGREGNRLRADVASQDRRLRGPMFISVDDRQRVNSITLEATDGRDRMRLAWDRR